MKHFLIIGNQNSRFYKDIWPYTKNGTIKLGYTHNHTDKSPDFKFICDNNLVDLDLNARWLTTLPVMTNHPIPYEDTTPTYQYFDNYPGILNVDRVKDIPRHYPGPVAVPTSIFQYDMSGYDIIDKIENGTINGKTKYRRIIIIRKKNEDN